MNTSIVPTMNTIPRHIPKYKSNYKQYKESFLNPDVEPKKYRVEWKTERGVSGYGEPLTYNTARAIIDIYNVKYPTMLHTIRQVQ